MVVQGHVAQQRLLQVLTAAKPVGFENMAMRPLRMLIWAPPGLQELVCVKIQEAGLQSYIRPVAQADTPAGPDGFRWRSSHLNIELDALMPYRNVPVPVRPVCSITRVVACSPSKRLFDTVVSARLATPAGAKPGRAPIRPRLFVRVCLLLRPRQRYKAGASAVRRAKATPQHPSI